MTGKIFIAKPRHRFSPQENDFRLRRGGFWTLRRTGPHATVGGAGAVRLASAPGMRGGALTEVGPDRWDSLLEGLGVTDAYYARGYLEASAPLASGEPAFLHLEGAGGDVVFPCLVRANPTDVVTPYGYGGPVGAGADPPLRTFAAAYEHWCAGRGAVTSFAVFHPLFANATSPAAVGFHRAALAGTVAWRLHDDDLLAGMHRHHRRRVRKAQETGLEAVAVVRPGSLDGFVALYTETMRRANASAFYFFDPNYWRALLAGVPLVRVDVRECDELVASVLGIGRPPWLHYHLGASSDAGRRAGASHLALYELARWGRANGYDTLHLGGGVGGRDDSLLDFKLRFAPEGRVDAQLGKTVHDVGAYHRLTGADQIDWDGFFPAYRRRAA